MYISAEISIQSLIIKAFAVALIISGYTNGVYLLGFAGLILTNIEILISDKKFHTFMLEANVEHCASLVVFVLSSFITDGFLPDIKYYAMAAFIAALLLPISVVNFFLKEGGE